MILFNISTEEEHSLTAVPIFLVETIQCKIIKIIYHNDENGYTIIRCRYSLSEDEFSAVGTMPIIYAGSTMVLSGTWQTNSKYGRQFSVSSFSEVMPVSAEAIQKYLESRSIKGIGPTYARKIVKHFGEDTLKIISKTPERLLEIDGIGKVRLERIKQSWEEQQEVIAITMFFQGYNVTVAMALKIYKQYGKESIPKIKENPYRLCDDIWGIGFKTADAVATKLGIDKESFIRIRSGILYALESMSNDGHCYAKLQELIEKAKEILEVEDTKIIMTLDEMKKNEDVISEYDLIYLPYLYYSEKGTAERIASLLNAERNIKLDSAKIIQTMRSRKDIQYDEIQLEAIKTAATSKVMVLTGGPGTGKTTTTLGIISAYQEAKATILLAAPTGRAAKRMSEATGMEAKTIHRLLEYKPGEGYQKNEEEPLEGDVLIVDECSMIDIVLMTSLMKALPSHMTLILVGDIDQLPSVGAGNVLKDIINSGSIPVVKLERIFRQAQGSQIIMNSHRINKGEKIDTSGGLNSDFFVIQKETEEEIAKEITTLCTKRLPAFYKVDPMKDIQILSPMKRGLTGTTELNRALQAALNPTDVMLKIGARELRLNDRMMQIRNNYDKGVFNGDIGSIVGIDSEEETIDVNFDGNTVTYEKSEMDQLLHAYAVTIHKSQGSEYPIVIMPFSTSHYIMLQRNLLYTGVTRAKKILVLVGQMKAINMAIANKKIALRNTMLAERIREATNSALKKEAI